VSLSAAVIDALVQAGATVEQLAAAVKADLAEAEQRVANRRAKDAMRQRKSRASRNVTVTPCDSADSAPNEYISNPPPPSETKVSSGVGTTAEKSKRGTRLPDDFLVPDDWIDWAVAKRKWSRADAIDEAERFCRYWQAKAGRDGVKLDWCKTWQNWVANSRRPDGCTAAAASDSGRFSSPEARQAYLANLDDRSRGPPRSIGSIVQIPRAAAS
jgi:hypothetical protein